MFFLSEIKILSKYEREKHDQCRVKHDWLFPLVNESWIGRVGRESRDKAKETGVKFGDKKWLKTLKVGVVLQELNINYWHQSRFRFNLNPSTQGGVMWCRMHLDGPTASWSDQILIFSYLQNIRKQFFIRQTWWASPLLLWVLYHVCCF